jgi:hypothetical protein
VIDQVRRDGLSFLDGVKKGTFTVPGDVPAVSRIYLRALTAYSKGLARAGSCSASTTIQPSSTTFT